MPISRPRGRPGDRLDPAPEPQSAFLFPRMPFAEIQEDMAAYNRPITKETFRNPTPDDFRSLLDFFIDEIYAKRPEDFAQPVFGCLDDVEYPEHYEDAIPKQHLAAHAQKLFTDAHFDDFSLRDLHAPEKVRFHWEVSALINFYKFRQTRLGVFEEITGNADDLAERARLVADDKAQHERDMAAIQAARARDEPQVEELRARVTARMNELSALHKQQTELQERIAEAKATLTSHVERAAKMKVHKVSEMEEVDRYRARVVSSPDRVKGELEDMADALAANKEEVASGVRRCKQMTNRAAAMEGGVAKVRKAAAAVGALLQVERQMAELEKEIEQREADKARKLKERREVEAAEAHLRRTMESVQQKLARIKEQSVSVQQQSSEADQALGRKEAEFEKEEREMVSLLEQKRAAVKERMETLVEEAETALREVELVGNQQMMLNEKFTAFHTGIEKAQELISHHTTRSHDEFRKAVL